MKVDVNLWAVLLAGISSMIIGAIYYSNVVFGKQWKVLAKVNERSMKSTMQKSMPLVFIAALLTSYVVAYFTFIFHSFFNDSWLKSGLEVSLILWLGVSLTTVYIHNAFEGKPTQLSIITVGNRLLSLLAMGLLVGLIHP